MHRRRFLAATGSLAAAATVPRVALAGSRAFASGPLRVHPQNPRYFTNGGGRAVLLTGAHTWNNLVDMGPDDPPQAFDFEAYLDWMENLGHNFIRLWTWETVHWDLGSLGQLAAHPKLTVAPHPWARTGPERARDGKPKFDLTRHNPEYFRRLRQRVDAAGRRGIYVSVMLFEGWGLQFAAGAWEAHPFHPDNNVNGLNGDPDQGGLAVHELAQPQVTAVQEAYVRKVIDTIGDLDNVLFEISNENHPPSTEWQYHFINFIKAYERQRPAQHPVGMTFQYRDGSNNTLFDSPADWISPNHQGGYRDNPPLADGRKVVLSDTDHLWGVGGNQAWVWKTFLRGHNPIFMDPYDGLLLGTRFDPQWEPIRQCLGHARRIAERIDLAAMTPRTNASSSRYALVHPGAEYLVYLPNAEPVEVDLSAAAGSLQVEWTHPRTGMSRPAEAVVGGARRSFRAPFDGDALLYLKRER